MMLIASALACTCMLLSLVRADLTSVLEEGQPITVADVGPPPPLPEPQLPQNLQLGDANFQKAALVQPQGRDAALRSIVTFWHKKALAAHLADYSNLDRVGPDLTPEDPVVDGPCYVSRSLAMVHIAMYDAYVGISRDAPTYLSYPSLPKVEPSVRWIAIWVAVSRAAETVIDDQWTRRDMARFAQKAGFRAVLRAILVGYRWGGEVADAVIRDRKGDGSRNGRVLEKIPAPKDPRDHRPDPTISPTQKNYAAHWGAVKGFGIADVQSKPGRLPEPGEAIGYFEDFVEVKDKGALPVNGSQTTRTAKQTETGIFWAYDGTFGIGTPPKMYNDVLDAVVEQAGSQIKNAFALVRLYTVVNVALADAGIAAWREKYHWNFWRPTVGIRLEQQPQYAELVQKDWKPLGIPKTNSNLVDATRNPSFPAYPSGHAAFGAAAFTAIQKELGLSDSFSFKFQSKEFDGEAKPACEDPNGPDCPARPEVTRTLTLSEANKQNQDARVWLGVHWRMDSEQGAKLGEQIGSLVSASFPKKA